MGSGAVHVSSLINGFCARQHYLADLEPALTSRDRVTGAHRVMWEIGKAVERHVVRQVIAARQLYGVVGRWECVCGSHSFAGVYSPAYKACRHCGGLPTTYKQLVLEDEAAGITGSPDLMLYVGRELLIVEVKSMEGDLWDALTWASPDHVFQACAYRKLAEGLGYSVTPKVVVLYVRKKFKWGNPYKEYHVNGDAANVALGLAWHDATELKQARDQEAIPPRITPCASIESTRAKSCPVSASCFMRRA